MSERDLEIKSVESAQPPYFAGVDVGGTNIKIGIVDVQGQILGYESIPTETEKSAEDASERMGEGVKRLVSQAGIDPDELVRVGLATPGPMETSTGMLLQPGNLPNWWNFPIRDRVSHHTGRPVTYANDANAAAYGEYWQGAGRGQHSMVLFTMGTGVGGGIVVGDLLIEGQHACGAECGHIVIDLRDDAPRDSLNKTGSLESYCGSYSIVRRVEEELAAGAESSISGRVEQGEQITPLMICEEAEAGDAFALKIVFDTARYLAIGIVTLVHTIDPNIVAIGGSVTFGGAGHKIGEEFLRHIQQESNSRMIESIRGKIQIQFAELGGQAGFIGAAGLARREHLR